MHRRRQLLREPSRHLRKAFSSKAKKPSERNARCAGATVPRKSVTTVTSTSSRISAAAVAAAESPLLPVRRHLSSFTEKKAWLPESEYELQNMTRQAMVYQLNLVQNNVANGLVHWFTTNMPAAYFRQVDKDTQMAHLRSLSAQWDHSNNKFMRAGGGEAFKGSNRIVLQSATSDGNLEVAYMDFSGNQKVCTIRPRVFVAYIEKPVAFFPVLFLSLFSRICKDERYDFSQSPRVRIYFRFLLEPRRRRRSCYSPTPR